MFDFPNAPTSGQSVTGSNGATYRWDGTKWAASAQPPGTVQSLTGGTGITLTPNPIVSTGTVALTVPVSVANGGTGASSFTANHLLVGQGTAALTASPTIQTDATNALIVNANLYVYGHVDSQANFSCRPGANAAARGNVFVIDWLPSTPQLWIDTSNVGTIQIVVSDERLKRGIKPASRDALAVLSAVKLFEFDLVLDEAWPVHHHTIGFMAHQLAECIPEAVTRPDDPGELLGVQLLPVTAYLVRAVQQLSAELRDLKARVR
jgi:hypothetical protein